MDIYNAEPKKQQGEVGLSLVIGSLDSAVDAQGGAPHSLADKSPHSLMWICLLQRSTLQENSGI